MAKLSPTALAFLVCLASPATSWADETIAGVGRLPVLILSRSIRPQVFTDGVEVSERTASLTLARDGSTVTWTQAEASRTTSLAACPALARLIANFPAPDASLRVVTVVDPRPMSEAEILAPDFLYSIDYISPAGRVTLVNAGRSATPSVTWAGDMFTAARACLDKPA